MSVPKLIKSTIIIFLCNILVSSQDFLEYYQPRSNFPKELNEWLSFVQEHKKDFKIISNIVKRRKEESDYEYDDKNYMDRNKLLYNVEDEYDEAPHNDISPHNFETQNSHLALDDEKRTDQLIQKFMKSNKPSRTRRESKNPFYENTNHLKIDSNGKQGEIKRSDNKYPDQFRKPANDLGKREIEIDVLNDGKLVKAIKESDKDSKSIVLNIEALHDDLDKHKFGNGDVKKNTDRYKITNELLNSPQKSSDISNNQIMSPEQANNYRNLYIANENLNTDSSIARNVKNKNVLMYHVTLKDSNLNNQVKFKNDTDASFQKNNFKDMSKYWTASEKHQMQKGIKFAQDTDSLVKLSQIRPKDDLKLSGGFEPVKSIVVEKKLTPQSHRQQNKRYSNELEGSVLLKNRQIDFKIDTTTQLQDNFDSPDVNLKSIELTIGHDAVDFHLPTTEQHITTPKNTEENQEKSLFDQHQRHPNKIHNGNENINNHIDITIIEPPKHKNIEENDVKHDDDDAENDLEDIHRDIDNEEQTPDQLNDGKTILKAYGRKIKINKKLENEEETDNRENDIEIGVQTECSENENQSNGRYEKQKYKNNQFKNNNNDVRLQIDISKNEDKQEYLPYNLPKRHSYHLHHKIRPVYCQGRNCNEKLRKFSRTKHRHRQRKNQFVTGHPRDKKNVMPFMSRQLQSDYVYDADIEAPVDEEYVDDQVSSEPTKLLESDEKDAVEGDYGDEEDSMPPKKNASTKLAKKTKNAFANPGTSSSLENEDDDDYYDDYDTKSKGKKKTAKHVSHEPLPKFTRDDHQAEFGKRRQKKTKSPPITKNQKAKHKDRNRIRAPRAQMNVDGVQQLPTFLIDDKFHEEEMRKRSLNNKKESLPNKFPLSSKGFFTKDISGKSNPLIASSNKPSISLSPNKNIAMDAPSRTTDFNLASSDSGPESSSLVINFNEIFDMASTKITPISVKCMDSRKDSFNENESINGSKILMSTILSIVPDTEDEMGESCNASEHKFEKLDEVLTGKLPNFLVTSIFDQIKIHPTFKSRFYMGLKQHHHTLPQALKDKNIEESKKLLDVMEEMVNKLQWKTNCQMLPAKYLHYLHLITKPKTQDLLSKTKQMEEIEFEDSQITQRVLFNTKVEHTAVQKVTILKDMLDKFEKLPRECKLRAEPVKKFIEDHLIMLKRSKPVYTSIVTEKLSQQDVGHESPIGDLHQKPVRRNEPQQEDALVEKTLESLGLGKSHNFKPKFSLDAMVEHNKQNIDDSKGEGPFVNFKQKKKTKKRDLDADVSNKYQKLLKAVRRERIKREGKRRLVEAFGKLNEEDYNGEHSNNVVKDVFESPLVFVV